MELCEKLKQIRKENNLTQQQLADELCLSRTVITKYERGHKVPNLDTIVLLSNYFKTSIFDEYKNKLKLFILSIRCCIPYLISLILLFASSLSLVSNIVNVNSQYGYNIYNDEYKVVKSNEIFIAKINYNIKSNIFNFSYIKVLITSDLECKTKNLNLNFVHNISDYCLIFNCENMQSNSKIKDEIIIYHKPFIYPLKDYDESLPYDKQTGECSKILNYYIDLIGKVK